MSAEHQEALRSTIQPLVKDFTRLIQDHDWIFGDMTPAVDAKSDQALLVHFEQADRFVRNKQCNKAQISFEMALKNNKGGQNFEKAESVGRRIEACFRRSGSKARIGFWARVSKPLQNAFGFRGRELALRRQGLILWSDDKFPQAKKMFLELLDQSQTWNDKIAESNAVYTLARIEENQSRFPESIKHYEEYVKRFPTGEHRENVLMSLVLLKSVISHHDDAVRFADQIIQEQSALDIDMRSPSTMSFALFWAGRLRLALGHRDIATEMWRRVASEYYSTFYGAVGHYMLERLTGKAYALQPSRTQKFSANDFFTAFSGEERQVVERAELLLRLGLREDAMCEISELTTNDLPEKVVVRSLLLFAAGDWLQAVKAYDSLPRSFRNRLPVGFERILFPKAYGDSITTYSENLGVDPDFVLAIIRQESVFNPKAKSSVGASGLMQLMPRTAKGEAQRLLRSYLTETQRTQLRQIAQRDSGLFDAETNLALGVHHVHRLLQKYKNPVFILTSYNANPGATKRWAENIPTDDFLVFIERIPYQETRQYVKLVLRNYFYYKRWYQKPSNSYPIIDQVLAVDVSRLNHPTPAPQNL
jgi:soluble lytic murein transglycosylase-like protein